MIPEIVIIKSEELDPFLGPKYKVKFGAEEKIFNNEVAARLWLYEKCDLYVKRAASEPTAVKQHKRKLLL
jgi:hypothetical protein